MNQPRYFTAIAGSLLFLQGISTLVFRLFPTLDRAFPKLLEITQMVPIHSVLHIVTGVLALIVLLRGGERGAYWFAAGIGIFYTGLAVHGFVTGTPTIFKVHSFDHPIHLLIGLWGLLAGGYHSMKRKYGSA